MKNEMRPYLFALSAVLLWSTVAAAFKVTLRYMAPLEMLFYAAIVSTAVLFVTLLGQKNGHLLMACSPGDFLRSAFLGFLNPFLYYVILFKAYDLLPAQEAQPLNWTWPIMLVLLSVVLLKQRIGWVSILAMALSFSGVFIVASRGDVLSFRFTDPVGVLLALGSSVIWALYWILNVKDRRDEVLKLFLNFLFGSIFILAAFLLSGVRTPSTFGLLGAAYIGLFEMGITFVLWLKALQFSRTTVQVGILIYAAPFLSLLFIHFVAGEKILPSTVIGLILIVSGIVIQVIGGSGRRSPATS